MWYSPFCNEKVVPIRKIYLWSAPQILIIHLKRFNFIKNFNKINSFVDFPLTNLDITKYIHNKNINNKTYLYDLFAINNHINFGMGNCGHYYSYCKNNDIWYNYNDENVNKIDDENILTNKAYILFYKLKV